MRHRPETYRFGTFAGVFTPSILTILGVIMYMRLGWVVGQGGILGAVGIILLAHVISVTTGLSISSIATDKKIRVGGIYYVLSRSLGLPMGGAIGITIYIGTALGIALYIIGFCENFLGVEQITGLTGLMPGIGAYRLLGTITIVFLMILAWISTALVIRTQFMILGAIALSLISVFTGFFLNGGMTGSVSMAPMFSGASFEMVFAIFFPAVTGFTAGVAMSGDLKDPRRSIPMGTMAAIITGLIIYLALAIGFGYFVDRDLLLGDKNFLLRIAWFSPLVIAGVWGATLSSALGGILGAPRILQAMSQDRVTPTLFGKGAGRSNEPRNALLCTFLIAEAGILIGELDVVARIVTMFYIAAYGFINLAFALERWASADFRPSFKVSRWIGFAGFFTAFAVMFKLDTVAMVLAFVMMTGIYFFLRKKELRLDLGDVWMSVWNSIVRTSLHQMDIKGIEERNWRPNIILFSGSTFARPYLVELGKDIVGKHGFLSNFDLIENPEAEILFPKHEQSVISEDSLKYKGVFTRRQSCRNFFDGVEMISRSYGFAGIEPNTVMMAWERQSLDPVRFAQTVKTLTGLDLNVILMDYDKRAGYGQKQRIDIWWRGQSNNGNLALSLMKFLWLSERWRKAQLRLLIVNPVNDYRESILQNASQILDNLRMRAEVRVINNQYEQRSFYEIVQQESVETDLTFLGLPDIEPGKEQPFVDEFNFLCQNIGTVILIRASSLFKELKIGGSTDSKKGMRRMERSLPEILRHEETRSREISFPGDPELDLPVRELYHSLLREYDLLYHNHLMVMGNSALETIRSIRAAAAEAFSRISSRAGKSGQSNNFIFRSQMEFLRESGRFLEQYVKDVTETQRDLLRNALLGYAEAMEAIASGLPRDISKVLDNNQIARRDGDGFALSLFKLRKRILKRFIRRSPVYRIRFRKLAGGYFPRISMEGLYDALQEFGMMGLYQSSGIRKFVYLADRLFQAMDSRQGAGDKDGPEHEIDWSQLDQQVAHLEKQVEESMKQLHLRMITYLNSAVRSLILDLQYPCSNRRIRKRDREGGGIIEYERILGQISEQWAANQEVLFNFPLLQVHLLVFGVQMRRISSDSHNRISRRIGQDILEVQKRFRDYLESYLAEGGKERGFRFDIPQTWRDDVRLLSGSVSEEFNRRIRQLFVKIPDQILLFPESSLDNYAVTQFSGLPTVSLSVSGYLDYLVQTALIGPIQETFRSFPAGMEEQMTLLQDIIRQIAVSITDEEDEWSPEGYDAGQFVREQISRTDQLIRSSARIRDQVLLRIRESTAEVDAQLSAGSFVNHAANLRQYIREQGSRRRKMWLNKTGRQLQEIMILLADQFWYRQSRGFILARKMTGKDSMIRSHVHDLLTLVERVSPRQEVMSRLPFYYRQLFLRRQSFMNEFWTGRERELEKASAALKRYERGHRGSIMVTGERQSGKSFFVHYMVSSRLPGRRLYVVQAPVNSTARIEPFYDALAESTGQKGPGPDSLANLEEGSILFFEDIELWWEKAGGGLQVIDLIKDMTERYSGRFIIVMSCNIHAFSLLAKMRPLEDGFLSVIRLMPLNAEELRDILLNRHRSGGLKLAFEHKRHLAVRTWEYARLFNRYYLYSQGNPGAALRAWMAHITSVEGSTAVTRSPRLPDLDVFDHLPPDWYVSMVLFVLHRRMNIDKLRRTWNSDSRKGDSGSTGDPLEALLADMKRAGILIEAGKGVFELNEWLYPFVAGFLIDKDIL